MRFCNLYRRFSSFFHWVLLQMEGYSGEEISSDHLILKSCSWALSLYIATCTSTILITVSPSAYPCHYSRALASDSILPPGSLVLFPEFASWLIAQGFDLSLRAILGGYPVPNTHWFSDFRISLVHRVHYGYNQERNRFPDFHLSLWRDFLERWQFFCPCVSAFFASYTLRCL